ncbi:MAG UNVERIFIED_CONTAM: hypothetical protein LVR18_49255 [Planctomycetaceae bacterium]
MTLMRMPVPAVGRAGGQIAELRMESVGDRCFNLVVQVITFLPAFFQRQSAVQHLDSQMIFLVDHDAVSLAVRDDDGGEALRCEPVRG